MTNQTDTVSDEQLTPPENDEVIDNDTATNESTKKDETQDEQKIDTSFLEEKKESPIVSEAQKKRDKDKVRISTLDKWEERVLDADSEEDEAEIYQSMPKWVKRELKTKLNPQSLTQDQVDQLIEDKIALIEQKRKAQDNVKVFKSKLEEYAYGDQAKIANVAKELHSTYPNMRGDDLVELAALKAKVFPKELFDNSEKRKNAALYAGAQGGRKTNATKEVNLDNVDNMTLEELEEIRVARGKAMN